MFDRVTAELVQAAPELSGVDSADFPVLLTRIHAWLVVLRMGLSESAIAGEEEEVKNPLVPAQNDIRADINLLYRLANTYEAYATALPELDYSGAAAYVAGTAHQLLATGERVGVIARRSAGAVSYNSISPDLAAILLFLIAGYPSDALEVADRVDTREVRAAASDGDIPAHLILAILDLARGDLRRITEQQDWRAPDPLWTLWALIFGGVKRLASGLLGDLPDPRAFVETFESVAFLSVAQLGDFQSPAIQQLLDRVAQIEGAENEDPGDLAETIRRAVQTYPGPHELARLLIRAGGTLLEGAVAWVPPPDGADPEGWSRYVKSVAERRPYLWNNHLEAIRRGYLDRGVSAVISFPTGAGKSTLTEMKIASTLHGGRRVVFLAPTRALVSQTVQNLKRSFPDHLVAEYLAGDGAYQELGDTTLADVAVMTPERCLMYLGGAPEMLTDTGLLIFDECHLLHPTDRTGRDRRSLDAMLCLLGVLDVADSADVVLLSAMVRNTTELAEWLTAVTGRPCLDEQLAWKPTRQVRGCIVYPHRDVQRLNQKIAAARKKQTTKGPPASLRRQMAISAHSLFGLTHVWAQEIAPSTYALLPLLKESVSLGLSPRWQLTGNKNVVAAELAAAMAASDINVLVFVQNKDHCASVAGQVAEKLGASGIELTKTEQTLLSDAAEELGGEEFVVGPFGGVAVIHHSLLLAQERRASESLFQRRKGARVLVATPTVAQGMNLPAEAVIIAGDGRFDESSGERERLTAHELLNAAGRAGRAGLKAAGIVIVIPDTIVTASEDAIRGDWGALRAEVFSKPDQCLDVQDPLDVFLDRIEATPDNLLPNRYLRYFLTRLPVDERDEDPATSTQRLLRRSLAAFKARNRGEEAWFESRIDRAVTMRRRVAQVSDRLMWLDRIVSTSGVPSQHVSDMDAALRTLERPEQFNVPNWIDWLLGWFEADKERLFDTLSPRAIDAAFAKEELVAARLRNGDHAEMIAKLRERIGAWVNGRPLVEIERSLGQGDVDRICKRARHFVNSTVYEIAYLAGTVAQVFRGQIAQWNPFDDGVTDSLEMPTALAVFGPCIREGMNSPEKLAFLMESEPYTPRVVLHRSYDRIADTIAPGHLLESFVETRRRVSEVIGSRR